MSNHSTCHLRIVECIRTLVRWIVAEILFSFRSKWLNSPQQVIELPEWMPDTQDICTLFRFLILNFSRSPRLLEAIHCRSVYGSHCPGHALWATVYGHHSAWNNRKMKLWRAIQYWHSQCHCNFLYSDFNLLDLEQPCKLFRWKKIQQRWSQLNVKSTLNTI